MISRDIIKAISFYALRVLSFKMLLNFSAEKVIFPFYHHISDRQPLHTKHLFKSISTEQFIKDLDFFLKYFTPASINDINNFSDNGKKSSKPLFLLSFDDGLSECFEIIAPILKGKGIPAIFFINSAFVDNKTLFHKHKCSLLIEALHKTKDENKINHVHRILNTNNSSFPKLSRQIRKLNYFDKDVINQIANVFEIDFDLYLVKNKPYMSTTQIQQLLEMGFNIGGHSVDHPEFYLLNNETMEKQVKECLLFLNEKFAIIDHYFAFPFTDDQVPQSLFQNLNRQENINLSFGTAGLKKDMETKHFQRIPMEIKKYNGAEEIIRSEYSYYFIKSFFGKNNLTRN